MLYVVATPIGNREDITLRALRILKEADYIIAEDTRKTGLLLKHYDIHKPLISFYEHNEKRRIPQIVEDLGAGKTVALVSSAGTPTISDPGYKLICVCREKNLPVTSAPGASSIVTALSLSSLSHEQFMFLGYAPRKTGARKKMFRSISAIETTFVFLESPYRIEKTLADLAQIFKGKRVCLARELTKKFEEVLEGSIEEIAELYKGKKARGEYIVILENRP
jgi:16S rRNA (cytidine1402-2'-O)-methyltransferase